MTIQHLRLQSKNLLKQKQFYTELLGLALLEEDTNSFSVKIGSSVLEYVYSEKATPYHFAINIPSNQEQEALVWLKARVEILPEKSEEEPQVISEIHDFDFWNAKAIYFYDEDKNIVELIARKNLNNDAVIPFSSESLLCIIEMGMPTADIKPIYEQLHAQTGLLIFSGSLERFCAMGDENALLICINKNLRKWYPNDDEAPASSFKAQVEVATNQFELNFKNDQLEINALP